jgi:hypothetical protein
MSKRARAKCQPHSLYRLCKCQRWSLPGSNIWWTVRAVRARDGAHGQPRVLCAVQHCICRLRWNLHSMHGRVRAEYREDCVRELRPWVRRYGRAVHSVQRWLTAECKPHSMRGMPARIRRYWWRMCCMCARRGARRQPGSMCKLRRWLCRVRRHMRSMQWWHRAKRRQNSLPAVCTWMGW